MILSSQIKSKEALKYTLDATLKHEKMHRIVRPSSRYQNAPIRILVPQSSFTRATVAWMVHDAYQEHGVPMFTSWVKLNGIDYWVIQEERSHVQEQGSSVAHNVAKHSTAQK